VIKADSLVKTIAVLGVNSKNKPLNRRAAIRAKLCRAIRCCSRHFRQDPTAQNLPLRQSEKNTLAIDEKGKEKSQLRMEESCFERKNGI